MDDFPDAVTRPADNDPVYVCGPGEHDYRSAVGWEPAGDGTEVRESMCVKCLDPLVETRRVDV